MKKIATISGMLILLTGLILSAGCRKKSDESELTGPVPVVTTVNYSNILIKTVDVTGNVTSDGGAFVKTRGFCWSSTNQNPGIQNDTIVAGDGAGAFAGTIKGLKGQTKFYIRAYATNSNGTGYGRI